MVFGLFNKQPVIDPVSSEWIIETYGWALQNFDADLFYTDTVLVCPTNEFFPGKVTSCLLYTSPSPRDKRQSRMPSSA